MAFIRVVEVFPPLFPANAGNDSRLRLEEGIEGFVSGVRSIRNFADVFLVAAVKNPRFLKLSTVEAAGLLRRRLRVDAAPVIVVRDMNRFHFFSTVLTGISLGLRSMMIAWGDRYPRGAGATNVHDFGSLSDAIREADAIRKRVGTPVRFFAPIDVSRLGSPKGVTLAKSRLRAGADLLLAQPPTTDSAGTFDEHVSLLAKAGLERKVLLSVFPFRNEKDVAECEKYFGWRLPRRLHRDAEAGEDCLLAEARRVAERIRGARLPGVYVATRGTPRLTRSLLS